MRKENERRKEGKKGRERRGRTLKKAKGILREIGRTDQRRQRTIEKSNREDTKFKEGKEKENTN